jgi:hypothetical protein
MEKRHEHLDSLLDPRGDDESGGPDWLPDIPVLVYDVCRLVEAEAAVMPLCGHLHLKLLWKYGVKDEVTPVLVLENVRCEDCGMSFAFDDASGHRCPLLMITSDSRGVMLAMKETR